MKTQKIYTLSAVFLFAGLIIFFIGFAMMDFNIMNFDTEPAYTSSVYDVDDELSGIVISETNADVKFTCSKDNKVHIKYYKNSRRSYDFSKQPDGTLKVSSSLSTDWKQNIGISVSTPTLTLMLPSGYKGDIKIDCGFGDILCENVTAGTLSLENETGDIVITGASFSGNLSVDTELGGIEVYNVTVNRTVKLSADDGGLFAQLLTASDIYADADGGNITLADISYDGSLFGDVENGNLQLSNINVGRGITLISENGDIKGNIGGAVSDFTYNCSAQNGECNLPFYMLGGDKQLNAKSENGDIEIYMLTRAIAE